MFLFGASNLNAQIDQFSYYGPRLQMDSLNNLSIGCHVSAADYRFTPLHSGTLSTVTAYLMGGNSPVGYADDHKTDGTLDTTDPGGTLLLQVETDDGSNLHLPSGTVLGSFTLADTYTKIATSDDAFTPMAISPQPSLQSGNIYHLVFTNTDTTEICEPGSNVGNYFSIDATYVFAPNQPQPTIPMNQFGALQIPEGGSQWVDLSDPGTGNPDNQGNQGTTPLVSIQFADGTTGGLGYYQVSRAIVGSQSGTAQGVREDFMPTNSITVNSVSVRFAWIQGGELHVQFQDSTGGDLDDCYFEPGTDFPSQSGVAVWKTCAFSGPYTMSGGSTYHVVMAVDTGTEYYAYGIENGAKTHDQPNGGTGTTYGSGTTYPNGLAEIKPASSWLDFSPNGGSCNCFDWEMYFTSPASGG